MNRLSIGDRTKIIHLMVEGTSLRSISRLMDVSINTITKLLERVGLAALKFHDETVVSVRSKRVEADEIWAFVGAKNKNLEASSIKDKDKAGDAWTWVAIDADSKLVINWLVGKRDADSARDFINETASRLQSRVQLTSDGFNKYPAAVDAAFDGEVDYAQLIKIYGRPEGNETERRYSPMQCTGTETRIVSGRPDPLFISTSYVERQNLTMRMGMRRFTRLTNGFSKKMENHCHAIAIHYFYYNFVRLHKSIRCTPAMAAKLTDRFMALEDIVRIAYAEELANEERIRARKIRTEVKAA